MKKKKEIRQRFRNSTFQRDGYKCACCFKKGKDRQGSDNHLSFHQTDDLVFLDAHHITDRTLMPNGGYVKENGISVCDECHLKAEEWWSNDYQHGPEGFSPANLYEIISSSQETAKSFSERLA